VHRRRRKNRETEAKRIEEEAFCDPPPLVFHWDDKLIQSAATSPVSEQRIAIVLTGTNFEEFLEYLSPLMGGASWSTYRH